MGDFLSASSKAQQLDTAFEKMSYLEHGLHEATARLIPEVQRQIDILAAQSKGFEEAQRRIRSQEAQLTSQVARLALLEKQVDDRIAALESKVGKLEDIEEQRYGEVKAELLGLRLGQTLRAPGPSPDEQRSAEETRRRAAETERQMKEAAAAERQRQRQELEAKLVREEAARRAEQEEADRQARSAEKELAAAAAVTAAAAAEIVERQAIERHSAAVSQQRKAANQKATVHEEADEHQASEEAQVGTTGGQSGGRLRKLTASQQKLYKLCKKKLKDIHALEAQLNSKQIKYRELSDEQKDKLKRRSELEETVAELERLAEEYEQKDTEVSVQAEIEVQAETAEPQVAEEADPEVEEQEEVQEEDGELVQEEQEEQEDPEVAAARAAEEAAAAAAAAAEALELQKQAWTKQRKQNLKKLKEIEVLEAKMEAKGQSFEDLLPEVKEKVSRKEELLVAVAELDRLLGDGEDEANVVQTQLTSEPAFEASAKKDTAASEPKNSPKAPPQEEDLPQPEPVEVAADVTQHEDGTHEKDADETKEDSVRTKAKAKAQGKQKSKKSLEKSSERKKNASAEIDALAAQIADDSTKVEKKGGLLGLFGL